MLDRIDSDGYWRSDSDSGSSSQAVVSTAVPVIYVSDDLPVPREQFTPQRGPLHAAARLLHAIADQVDELRHRLEQQSDRLR
jgi:hypothetical protein